LDPLLIDKMSDVEDVGEADLRASSTLRSPFQLYFAQRTRSLLNKGLDELTVGKCRGKYRNRFKTMEKSRKYKWIRAAYELELESILQANPDSPQTNWKLACECPLYNLIHSNGID
jgi:hypothetical protein